MLLPGIVERLAVGAPERRTLIASRSGAPMTVAELDAALLYAAHDAAIDGPDDVTSAALHHTAVCFLVRQGIRFADLVELVGDLGADALARYRPLVPAGPRRSIDDVERSMPVLRELTGR